MKFFASTVVALASAASLVSGSPTPEGNTISARGYGCPFSSNQCAFHCINDVRKKCSGSSVVLRPVGGNCGGLGWATCKCNYNKNCP